jgi:hypothetical protein
MNAGQSRPARKTVAGFYSLAFRPALAVLLCLLPAVLLGQWVTTGTDTLTRGFGVDRLVGMQNLAVDGRGCLHAVWAEWSPMVGPTRIFYARKPQDSVWTQPELVADSACSDPALAVEFSGDVHVVYTAPVARNNELFYAARRTGGWQRTRLTNDTFYDWTPAIALEGSAVHIARVIRDKSGVYHIGYLTNRSGSWEGQTLSGSRLGDFGLGAAPYLAVSPGGIAHVSYRGENYPDYKIHFAENRAPGDTSWRYDVMATVNLYDYASALTVLDSGEAELVVSGNDGWGMPFRTCYLHRPAGSQVWDQYQLMTADASAELTGYAFDSVRVHAVWAETDGNFYTGDIYYCGNYAGRWLNAAIRADGRTSSGSLVVDAQHQGHCLVVSPTVLDSEQVMCVHSASLGGVRRVPSPTAPQCTSFATIVHGELVLPPASSCRSQAALLDIAGRKVMELHPGQNDVSRLGAGVYFARSAVSGQRSAVGGQGEVRKVVIQR